MLRLKDKIAVVAGAGPGMGRASALLFAEEGAKVAVISRQKQVGEETVAQIEARGGTAFAIAADLMRSKLVESAFEQILEKYGRIDVLHCNAGAYGTSPVEKITEESWDQIVDANLKCCFFPAQAAIPHMAKNGSGSIIFTAAIFGPLVISKNMAHYNASKAGVVALTKSLAVELAPHNIRVNCVCPGQISHQLHTSGKAALHTDRALMRTGLPEDGAFAVLYFASDESAWVTGSTLAVDGGMSVGVRLIPKTPQAEKTN